MYLTRLGGAWGKLFIGLSVVVFRRHHFPRRSCYLLPMMWKLSSHFQPFGDLSCGMFIQLNWMLTSKRTLRCSFDWITSLSVFRWEFSLSFDGCLHDFVPWKTWRYWGNQLLLTRLHAPEGKTRARALYRWRRTSPERLSGNGRRRWRGKKFHFRFQYSASPSPGPLLCCFGCAPSMSIESLREMTFSKLIRCLYHSISLHLDYTYTQASQHTQTLKICSTWRWRFVLPARKCYF